MANGNSGEDMSFDAPVREAKSVDDTKMLKAMAADPFATGTNVLKRQETKHKPFGGLGIRGFADSSGKSDD